MNFMFNFGFWIHKPDICKNKCFLYYYHRATEIKESDFRYPLKLKEMELLVIVIEFILADIFM